MWLNYTGLCNTFCSLPRRTRLRQQTAGASHIRGATRADPIHRSGDHSEPQLTSRNTRAGSCSLPHNLLDAAFAPNAILLLSAAPRGLFWPQPTGAAEQDLGYMCDVLLTMCRPRKRLKSTGRYKFRSYTCWLFDACSVTDFLHVLQEVSEHSLDCFQTG